MTNLPVVTQWVEDIYQIETTDNVLGGIDGIANKQALSLSNRTHWLKNEVEKRALINGDELNPFEVKKAELAKEAVNLEQMNELLSTVGFPIGHEYPANKTVPASNELLNLGGEYSRVLFPKLWAYIQTEVALLKTDAEWHIENDANGMCGYFSSGDGITTFRLKNYENTTIKAVNGVDRLPGSFQDHKAVSENLYWHDSGSISTPPAGLTRIGVHNGGNQLGYIQQVSNVTQNPQGTTVKNIGGLPIIVAK